MRHCLVNEYRQDNRQCRRESSTDSDRVASGSFVSKGYRPDTSRICQAPRDQIDTRTEVTSTLVTRVNQHQRLLVVRGDGVSTPPSTVSAAVNPPS